MADKAKTKSSIRLKSQSPPKSAGRKDSKPKSAKSEEEDREIITLAWRILSQEHVEMLRELTVHELEAKLSEILQIEDYHLSLKEASTLDYYVAGFWFCKEQNFNAQQTSAFFTVLKILFDNIKERHMNLVDNMKEFRSLLAGIGLDSSTAIKNGGLECFNLEQAKLIADYFTNSIFQHYKVYEFVLHVDQDEEIVRNDLVVEVPPPATFPFPPPLDEGMEEQIWLSHVASPAITGVDEAMPGIEGEGEGEEKPGDEHTAMKSTGGEPLEPTKEDLLTSLHPDQVQKVIEEVANEMLGNFKSEVDMKLKEKEASMLSKISKLGGGR